MSEPTDFKETMAAQVSKARRREILFPTIWATVLFALLAAAAIWAGFTCEAAMTRLSDSLITLLFIIWTFVCLALILINAVLIALIIELRKNLPDKLDTANEKVRETEPVVLDALNRFSEPIIGLIAKFNALFQLVKRT